MMATWMWLNIPLLALVFAATAGIPLWLVVKHPDRRPESALAVLPRQRRDDAIRDDQPVAA